MGMFDTIIFPAPIKCDKCGKEITSTQTKMFENMMEEYSVGDLIPKNVITGVLRETLYCNHDDEKMKASFDQEIFLAVWHNLLIGIKENYEEAYQLINSFGTGDLYLLYRDLFRERNKYRYKFNAVKRWTERYIEYKGMTEKEISDILTEDPPGLAHFHIRSFIKSLRETDTPFKDFLEKLKQQKYYGSLIFL